MQNAAPWHRRTAVRLALFLLVRADNRRCQDMQTQPHINTVNTTTFDQRNELSYRKTQPMLRQPSKTDSILRAIGLIDQAVLTLLQLRNLRSTPQLPQSLTFNIIRTYDQFDRNANVMSQLKTFAAAGSCVAGLARSWKSTFSDKTDQSPYRYYMLASLAAASIMVPWLLLRKRD